MLPTPKTAAVWIRQDQQPLVQRAFRDRGVRMLAAGGPDRPRLDLGQEADADDIRSLLEADAAGIIIIGDPGTFADGTDPTHLRTLLNATRRTSTVLTIEPIPPRSTDTAHPSWRDASDVARERVAQVPMLRRGAAWRTAADLLESFGPIDAISLHLAGPRRFGSLGARLGEAADLLTWLLGAPLAVDATHTPAGPERSRAESLRGLHGHLAAVFRFEHGQSASLFATDQAGDWRRSTILLGPSGRLDVTDTDITWTDPAGLALEKLTTQLDAARLGESVFADEAGAVLGDAPRLPPIDANRVLATAHAAVLSLTTGHPEDPRALERIAGMPT
ncbi:MAG: hypothetical protein AAGH71_02580 [Planctomycetota bacterium]